METYNHDTESAGRSFVRIEDTAALLAELDRWVAHLDWLARLAEECGFDEIVADIRCDIAVIDGWREAVQPVPAVLH